MLRVQVSSPTAHTCVPSLVRPLRRTYALQICLLLYTSWPSGSWPSSTQRYTCSPRPASSSTVPRTTSAPGSATRWASAKAVPADPARGWDFCARHRRGGGLHNSTRVHPDLQWAVGSKNLVKPDHPLLLPTTSTASVSLSPTNVSTKGNLDERCPALVRGHDEPILVGLPGVGRAVAQGAEEELRKHVKSRRSQE